jgi:ABC-type enterochelin transport system ATPase subunit
MHTREDRHHWRGQTSQLEEDAELYIRRCYEFGLEAIAITDHNRISEGFLTHIRQAIDRLANEFGYEIILFPGFEVAGPIGKGAHLICLFEPGSDLGHVDSRLTQLGLPPDHRFDGKDPLPVSGDITFNKLLGIVQDDKNLPGICIAAHPNDSGVMDSETVEQWWSQKTISNSDLLCIELPRPRHEYINRKDSLIKSVLQNADPRYTRRNPIASVCSSDSKKLLPEDEEDCNFIGFRHTWIKMSHPSIEALRQAFLDHESRIAFGSERPEHEYDYPMIKSISVSGATFLADQEIVLSSNLTSIIGGRGTGKSTIVEYLRLALDQESSVRGEEPTKNLSKLKRTLTSSSKVKVRIEKEGQSWLLQSHSGDRPTVVEGHEIPEVGRFFPLRVLSQREVYSIAEDREARAHLVDDVAQSELDKLVRQGQDLMAEIRRLNQQIAELPNLEQRKRDLETDQTRYQLRVKRLQDSEQPLNRLRQLVAEERFFRALAEEGEEIATRISDSLQEIELAATVLGSELSETPNRSLIEEVTGRADHAAQRLRDEIRAAVVSFQDALKDLLDDDRINKWHEEIAEERVRADKIRQELAQLGDDPDSSLDPQRQLREAEVQLSELEKRIKSIGEFTKRRDDLVDELYEAWRAETKLRENAADLLNNQVPRTDKNEPFVKVSIEPYGDKEAFLSRARMEIRDGRRISVDDWNEFMESVYDSAGEQEQETSCKSLFSWMNQINRGERPQGCPWQLDDRRLKVVTEWLSEERLDELRLWRTPDLVKVELYRNDGTLVGHLEGPELSVGQRCTAVLALLLAQNTVPIIIDQPEEDLDNEFVYQELVPLLRQAKLRRQVIVVTHNANIPVNGDAELIVALEVRDRKGRQKVVSGSALAVGALDNPATKSAVETIMEGSEQAFRNRYDKYGF